MIAWAATPVMSAGASAVRHHRSPAGLDSTARARANATPAPVVTASRGTDRLSDSAIRATPSASRTSGPTSERHRPASLPSPSAVRSTSRHATAARPSSSGWA